MLIKITGRHMDVTEAMRGYVEKKLSRLPKYNNRISEIEVTIIQESLVYKLEMMLKADNNAQRFVVTTSSEDMYASVDEAVDKLERQLTKHKEKYRSRKGRARTADALTEPAGE